MKTKISGKKITQRINRKDPAHLYVQLLNILRAELNGLKNGERFYTDRQLCKLFKVSQPTVRSALSALMKEGLIERVPYRGTFVSRQEKAPIKKKTMSIGLISHFSWYSPHIMAVKGVENMASEYGYSTVVSDWTNGDDKSEESVEFLPLLVEKFRKREVDGIIIVSPVKRNDREMPACLRNLNMPLVLVNWNIRNNAGIPEVLADYEEGAYNLVTHLINLGYENIVYIGCSVERQAFMDRFNGYRRALQDNGIEYDPASVYRDLADFRPGTQDGFAREVMTKIIASGKCPRAVFTATDVMAIAAMDVIQKNALHVPEDIAVAGFDNSSHGSVIKPALTTATQPYYEMGMNAMEVLKTMIEGRHPGALKVMVPCKLIVRESCGGKIEKQNHNRSL